MRLFNTPGLWDEKWVLPASLPPDTNLDGVSMLVTGRA